MSGIGSGACAVVATLALAAPVSLGGLYQVGEVGLVEFSTDGGAVVGRYRGGGLCDFEPAQEVVRGSLEGSVFVGQVVLCQNGAGCAPRRTFPLLAFTREDRLLGMVQFEPGCGSRATDDRRLLFTRVADGDDGPAPVASVEGGRRPAATETSARAWLAFGAGQLQRRDFAGAIGSLERGVALAAQREGERSGLFAQLQYQLAGAYAGAGRKRQALQALGKAAESSGTSMLERLEHDPALEAIRGEPEFSRLAADLRLRRAKRDK